MNSSHILKYHVKLARKNHAYYMVEKCLYGERDYMVSLYKERRDEHMAMARAIKDMYKNVWDEAAEGSCGCLYPTSKWLK